MGLLLRSGEDPHSLRMKVFMMGVHTSRPPSLIKNRLELWPFSADKINGILHIPEQGLRPPHTELKYLINHPNRMRRKDSFNLPALPLSPLPRSMTSAISSHSFYFDFGLIPLPPALSFIFPSFCQNPLFFSLLRFSAPKEFESRESFHLIN